MEASEYLGFTLSRLSQGESGYAGMVPRECFRGNGSVGARSSTKVIVSCVGASRTRYRAHDVIFKFAVKLVVDPVYVGYSTSYRPGGWWVLYQSLYHHFITPGL